MSFREMVTSDISRVFLNTLEFAEQHTIIYDGVTYENINCVMTKVKEQDRTTTMRDHAQGLFLVSAVLHCALADMNNIVPEKGGKIKVSEGAFLRTYYVAQSGCDMGMIRLELEAIDE